MVLKYIVDRNTKYNTINEILINEFKLSNRLMTKLIKNKKILLNNVVCDTRNNIKLDDIIIINLDIEEESSNIVPTKMNLSIIYEDEWMLVLNKPAGLPVHPSNSHYTDSLSNGVKFYFDKIKLNKKIRPVNRLDLNTSGLVIFAKCEYIQEELSRQMQNMILKKEYICVANGILVNKSGTINLPIARKPGSIIERCIDSKGQYSVTHYTVLKENKDYSLIKCLLETGRTHQIRIHFASIGHPLLGDTLYGSKSDLISRQALHSYKISLIHPITKTKLDFISEIPKDISKLF
jgi:23S rRNA pseudouridine1911/1915/1917 synthase